MEVCQPTARTQSIDCVSLQHNMAQGQANCGYNGTIIKRQVRLRCPWQGHNRWKLKEKQTKEKEDSKNWCSINIGIIIVSEGDQWRS